MSGIDLTGDWELAQQLLNAAPDEIEKAMRKAVLGEAHHFEAAVKRKIQKGPPPPLRAARMFGPGKGGTKPLVASGDMLGSVTVVEGSKAEAFIGIPRSATAHGGKVVRLAEIHEFGRTIVVKLTPKMLGFLFGVLFKGQPRKSSGSKKGFLVIHIPARPFIRPAFEEESAGAQGRFLTRVSQALGGRYGTP